MRTHQSSSKRTNTSRFISLILRHHPEIVGISLDEHGWADVDALIAGVNRTGGHSLDLATLQEIVRTDEKQRYAFSSDGTRIRANQGHSIPVSVELQEMSPPPILWHGTAEKSVKSILSQGLKPGSRLYVHLSGDAETARKVGSRHGKPVIFEVNCRAMADDGHKFYLSANHVWLVKAVPPKYLRMV